MLRQQRHGPNQTAVLPDERCYEVGHGPFPGRSQRAPPLSPKADSADSRIHYVQQVI